MPTVVVVSPVATGDNVAGFNTAAIEPPYILVIASMHIAHRAELGTGPPPGDLVVNLQRLVI